MSRRKKQTEEPAQSTPFDALPDLHEEPDDNIIPPPAPTSRRNRRNTNRGRLDIIRETAHRGGKVVTVIANFKGIGLPEKQELMKKIQKSYGVGGTIKDGRIEIRGDLRDEIKEILEEAGFRPVFAGG